MNPFTILTAPLSSSTNWSTRGHYGVTRSLLNGLQKTGLCDYNFQPEEESQIHEHVHVLYGAGSCKTLSYALQLKERGLIKQITGGPNIFNFPWEQDGLIDHPDLSMYLLPSEWFRQMFSRMDPACSDKLRVWAAGVDSALLEIPHTASRTALLYEKKADSEQLRYGRIIRLIEKAGFLVRIFKYGDYEYEEYIDALKTASFLIAVSDTESQGLYLAEAWAMDVPTICFEAGEYTWPEEIWGTDIYWPETSACPYLTEHTGVRFQNESDLKTYLRHIHYIMDNTQPRAWVAEHMTDEVCARHFLDLLDRSTS